MKTILKLFLPAMLLLVCMMAPGASEAQTKKLSGDLIIFHAGSLSVPMKEAANAFMKVNPDVKVLLESAGSVASARKITDLNRACDIMASADYAVIDNMLIPKFADFNIKFVSNEMAIVYSDKSRRANEINAKNWYEIILQQDVAFGRADPNADPCGYRTLMTLQLSEKFYGVNGLVKAISGKDQQYIRPKEVDLLALLESGSIDYIFLYKSVAMQHGLKYLVLPDQVNLKNSAYAADYGSASVEINGKKPGEKETMKGEPMVYGITMLRGAPNKEAAIAFLEFLLSKDQGMKIMEKNGQPSVIPMPTQNYNMLPASLKKFATEK